MWTMLTNPYDIFTALQLLQCETKQDVGMSRFKKLVVRHRCRTEVSVVIIREGKAKTQSAAAKELS